MECTRMVDDRRMNIAQKRKLFQGQVLLLTETDGVVVQNEQSNKGVWRNEKCLSVYRLD